MLFRSHCGNSGATNFSLEVRTRAIQPVKSQLWNQALETLLADRDLSGQLSKGVMEEILSGSRSEAEIAEFLAIHTRKGGTSGEVAGFIDAMYEHAAPISINERAVDTVGTGGDGFHTINISTASAIVAASAGEIGRAHV